MKTIIKNPKGEIIKEIDAKLGETLLNQARAAWVDLQFACLSGICSSCMCNIEKWAEFLDPAMRMEPGFPIADDEIMTCIGGIKKDISPEDEATWEIILKTFY